MRGRLLVALAPAGSVVQVRRAARSDIPAIAALLAGAFAPLRGQYTAAAYQATTPDAQALARRWSEGPIWLAVDGARPVGTVAAVARPDGQAYVRSMAVDPGARGQGIGRALLDEVERWARANASQALVLSTTPFLHAAIRLYRGAGFAPAPDGPHDLHGTPLLTMRKDLAGT